jgi:ubiquitin-protein ligase
VINKHKHVAQGAWKPSINIATMLTSIQQLLGDPNPDDALDADIVCCYSALARGRTCGVAPEKQQVVPFS